MLLVGRNLWKLHGRWLVFVSLAALAAILWTLLASRVNGRWPGGGSLSGLTLGLIAAAIFVFEMALVARKTKTFRTARWLGSAQLWMKAHIWLGLLTVPLVVLHSGGRLGGTLTSLLVAAFAIVIASGLWGLALQNVIPRLLLAEVPVETVYSQIDLVGQQYAEQARRLVAVACGDQAGVREQRSEVRSQRFGEARVGQELSASRGAARNVGLLVERSPQPPSTRVRPIASPVINEAMHGEIGPYLDTGRPPSKPWNTREGQALYFGDLQLRVAPELRSLVGQLEELCDRRRQLGLQQRLHFWLHNWLWVHLPLSTALMILLAAHVVFALLYG